MIDFAATVDPRHGLAEVVEIAPPRPPADLLWRTLVRLAGRPGGDTPPASGVLTPFVVGAYGHSRADCVSRGVGEAVERFALLRPGQAVPGEVEGSRDEIGPDRALAFHDPGVALGHPDAAGERLTWYPARRLRDGAEVLVPAALVDYPAAPGTLGRFDPGPSGAASGPDAGYARRNALLEVVERDAFLTAWHLGLTLHRLDAAALDPVNAGDPRQRRAAQVLATVRSGLGAHGLESVVAEVPTAVPGVCCATAALVDRAGPWPRVTVGVNASDSAPVAALGAVQESLQLRSLLCNFADAGAAPAVVGGENDRLGHLASEAGAAALLSWVEGFADPRPPSAAHPGAGTGELLDALVADGADPLLVDLTFRLPDPLRAMGWCAVKVIPVGYQQLRIDDRHTFSWNRPRLHAVARRYGGSVPPVGAGSPAGPHPLP